MEGCCGRRPGQSKLTHNGQRPDRNPALHKS
jgi:hypothetical protein